MKKQTKPMSLKKQLMSAVSMMLAAAVALGSSTYAWFVNKSRAEVKEVLFQASAGKNLEIAGAIVDDSNVSRFADLNVGGQVPQGKANLLTYYSSVTPDLLGEKSFSYPKFDASAANPIYMTPVSIDGADLKIKDSSTIFYENEGWDTKNAGYDTYHTVTGNADKKYICAQLYFRASEDMDVYLNKAEWVSYADTNTPDATNGIEVPFITQYKPTAETDTNVIDAYKQQAIDMSKALRIAFVPGEIADGGGATTETPIVSCFNTATFTNAVYNTVNSGALITADTPVKSIDNTTKKITALGTAVTTDLSDYTIENGSVGAYDPKNPSVTGKTPLFHLEAGVPKRVTIYIWLEGTDKECVNAISSYIAGVYLPFIGTIANDDGTVSTYSVGDGISLLEDDEPVGTVE